MLAAGGGFTARKVGADASRRHLARHLAADRGKIRPRHTGMPVAYFLYHRAQI